MFRKGHGGELEQYCLGKFLMQEYEDPRSQAHREKRDEIGEVAVTYR